MSTPAFAVLNVFKEEGATSHDVVAQVRRIYGLKKVGHTGTLDPVATGVLPVCLGQATRLIEYMPTGKRYTAEVTFGTTTTTLDGEGDIIAVNPCPDLAAKDLESVLPEFSGEITQEVPLYSATHMKGKKLYQIARELEEEGPEALIRHDIRLPKKTVSIERIELVDFTADSNPDHPVAVLDIECGSGTYIRSLARDLGERLGCGAYLSGLTRTAQGRFSEENAVTIDELKQSARPEDYLEDPLAYLDLPVIPIPFEEQFEKLINGMKIQLDTELGNEPVATDLKPNQPYLLTFRKLPVCVARAEGKTRLKPVKVFSSLFEKQPV